MEPDRQPRRRRRSQAHHRASISYEKLRSLMQPYFSSCNISKWMLLCQVKMCIVQLENSIVNLSEQNEKNGSYIPFPSTLEAIQMEFIHQYYSASHAISARRRARLALPLHCPGLSSPRGVNTHEEAAEPSRALQELPVECDAAQRFTAGSQMNTGLDQPEDGSYRIPQSWFPAGSTFGFLSDGVCDTSQLLQCTESFEDDEL
ncbi:uncharacterized protein LOC116954819 isoform X2 [Petromyzon marinus]|uniref:Uncharacterized protein LOC116954819 isoform X1 n=1 Tax=Petromyzon marinus TaxID=7757 RepID=A0AAJ7U811_PETMA|nr:uncharacterized protein LOC116954819 isoform X1 [Petromyzon marinus]XP_032831552.1 uncharacterized protein LOC116954819 isoform X1 [Petromyzon marinus]XP_032831553.1 uncharacterized protein LOC116954819 isoform X1 [Petromyzon marinus]